MQLFRTPSNKMMNGQLSTSLVLPDPPSIKQKNQLKNKSHEDNHMNKHSHHKQIGNRRNYNNQQSLLPILEKSEKLVNNNQILREELQNSRHGRQSRVYAYQASNEPNQMLGNMYNNLNRNNRQLNKEIEEVIKGSVKNNMGVKGIKQGSPKRRVPKKKDELKELQEVDKYRLLKIKNGEIRNKIGDLRQKLEEQYYVKKARQKNMLPEHDNIKDSDYYSLENPRTQQAKVFVSQLQSKRKNEHQRALQAMELQKLRRQQEQHQKMMQKMAEQEERKHILQIQAAEKRLKRNQEEQQKKKKQSQIRQWSEKINKGHQTPLYIRKEHEYIQNSVIPKLYEKHRALQNRKQMMSLNFDDIEDHEQKYIHIKDEIDLERLQKMEQKQIQMIQDQQQQSKLYKGKYRYHALEDMYRDKILGPQQKQQRDRQIQKIKKARQLLYSDGIREKQRQKPFKTLEHKKQFKRRVRGIDGTIRDPNLSHRSDPRADGKRNLNYLHNLIQEKGKKQDAPYIKLIAQKGTYPDYLQESREIKKNLDNSLIRRNKVYQESRISRKSGHDSDQEQTHKNASHNFQSDQIKKLEAISKSMDQRIKRNYRLKKHDRNVEFEDDRRMEQEDIEAVKARLNLLRRID